MLDNGEFTLLFYALMAKLYRGMLCSMMYTIMSYFLSRNIKTCVSNISEVQLNQSCVQITFLHWLCTEILFCIFNCSTQLA